MLKRVILAGLIASGCLAIMPSIVRAQEGNEEPLPEVGVLTCGRQCTNFVRAKPKVRPIPGYPREERIFSKHSEAFVLLRYTVGTDGKTRDIVPVYVVGPAIFQEQLIEDAKQWTFEPATLEGKPIEESRYLEMIYFPGVWPQVGARRFVQDVYEQASSLLRAGKQDEAQAILSEAFDKPQLTIYERAMLALPLAKMMMGRKDYLEVRRIALAGTIGGTLHLPAAAAQELWQLRISADLMLGEISDALTSFRRLRIIKGYEDASPFSKMLWDAEAKAEATPRLVVQARIPQESEGGTYWHTLYRRAFTFTAVKGSLDSFVLGCAEGMIESKITATAQWHIPRLWGSCRLYVRGTPGTTFQLVETNDDDNPAQMAAAIARHDEAVRARPQDAMVYMARARAYDDARNYPAAIADFSKAIEINPKLVLAYQRRSVMYRAMGRFAEAFPDADAAIKIDPKNTDLYFMRASLRRAVGQYRESLEDYDQIKDPSALTLINRAITLFCLGEFREAEESLEKALKQTPNDLYVYNWLHVLRAKRKASDAARYSKFLTTEENYSTYQIANLFRGTKTLTELEARMAADKSSRDNPRWACSAKFFFAQYKLEKGDPEGARKYLGELSPANCDYAEADAAVAELKRLDNPVKPVGANRRR